MAEDHTVGAGEEGMTESGNGRPRPAAAALRLMTATFMREPMVRLNSFTRALGAAVVLAVLLFLAPALREAPEQITKMAVSSPLPTIPAQTRC